MDPEAWAAWMAAPRPQSRARSPQSSRTPHMWSALRRGAGGRAAEVVDWFRDASSAKSPLSGFVGGDRGEDCRPDQTSQPSFFQGDYGLTERCSPFAKS